MNFFAVRLLNASLDSTVHWHEHTMCCVLPQQVSSWRVHITALACTAQHCSFDVHDAWHPVHVCNSAVQSAATQLRRFDVDLSICCSSPSTRTHVTAPLLCEVSVRHGSQRVSLPLKSPCTLLIPSPRLGCFEKRTSRRRRDPPGSTHSRNGTLKARAASAPATAWRSQPKELPCFLVLSAAAPSALF